MEINSLDIVLCEFYFSDLKQTKKRPVLVFKDNLPYDDFVAIPLSSKVEKLHNDEYLIENSNLEQGSIPKSSKIMIRKTFVVSKKVVIKKYGIIDKKYYKKCLDNFCKYFGCHSKETI